MSCHTSPIPFSRRQARQPDPEVEPEARLVGRRDPIVLREPILPGVPRRPCVVLRLRVEADDPEAARCLRATVKDVHGAAAAVLVPNSAAVLDVTNRVVSDPADPDGDRVLALLEQPGPGTPGGGSGLGHGVFPVLRPEAPERGLELILDGGQTGGEVLVRGDR